jgi:alpha-glucosidase
MKPVRSAHSVIETERGVILDCGHGLTCRVSILAPDLARVVFLQNGAPQQPRTWSVLANGATDVPWHGRDRLDESSWPKDLHAMDQGEGEIRLSTEAMSVTIVLSPLAFTWALRDGTVFAQDRPSAAVSFGARGLRHAFARHIDDRYHGLGDKTGPINLHGRRLRTTMLDSLGYDPERGDPLYKHWPFLIVQDGISGATHGLYYDNLADAAFDLGCEHDNYHGLYRSYEAAGGDLDYYIFPGSDITDITRKFLSLTGRPALPPRWTLGFAQTAMAIADSDNAQERMEDFIARCASENIPVSAFHFGSGYTSIGPKRYVFTWNRSKYPDPEGLLAKFHAAGIHLVANLKPCLLDDHPRYAEPAGAYIKNAEGEAVITQFWDGEGAYLDFSHPKAVEWWQAGVTRDVLGTGFDAAWNDNNEYGFAEDGASCHGFGDTIPLDLARPLQPYLMTRASMDATRAHAPGKRPFTVTRAGMPGVQRYAQTWTGDNDTSWHCLAWNMRMAATMSLSGLSNTGHDIGGFSGPVPNGELLIRWTQAGVVHPRMIMNSWKPNEIYTSPWLHPEATPAIRAAIRLRYRLMPYLYSLMHKASADGTPPLLPTCAVFPQDDGTHFDSPDLMLGPFLLAAPVVEEGERSRDVYLPAGPECWFDFWSGERLPAGQFATLAAPLDRLPLVVAAGGILPMTDSQDFSRLHDEPSRCLRLFPGHGTGTSEFVMTEDDGTSEAGPRADITITMSWNADDVMVRAAVKGEFPLPFKTIFVAIPEADQRTLHVGDLLTPKPFQA